MRISLMDMYSDDEFRRIILSSFSYHDCMKNLGYNATSGTCMNLLKAKIEALNIDTSHFKTPHPRRLKFEDVFSENSSVDRSVVRKWYKKGNYAEYKCSICGQEPFWNGMPMTLIMDHINGVNNDNRLKNLRWVCGNCNIQLDTTNGKNHRHKLEQHKLNYCVDCGQVITCQSVRCLSCEHKHKTIPFDKMPVTKEELKHLIRTKSFLEIGKMYNVSDNAIRKWCNKFNLPRKKSDIIKYSDEEWNNI